MTKQEKHLWYDYLQHYPVKVYKQRVIGNYIADFFCHKAGLVIELDGSQHYSDSGEEKDKIRTDFLQSKGFYVLRFTNTEVDKNFEGVCYVIDSKIKERLEEKGIR